MRVLLRVVRASVWLSSRALTRPLSFLALVQKQGKASYVAVGSLDDDATAIQKSSRGIKRWLHVPIKYNDTTTANGQRRAVEVEVAISPDEEGGGGEENGAVEIVLFVVSGGIEETIQKQSIACVARTSLHLHATDLAAVDGAQEVLFKSFFEDELGSVEITLQRADPSVGHLKRGEGTLQGGGGGSFSVQWTSSEALERDLAAQERTRLEAETMLLERLVAVAREAKDVRALRTQAVKCVRHKRAATVIQSAYRAVRRHRREQRRQRRREQDEMERSKKAAVRAKVMERNQRRTQRLIDEWTSEKSEPEVKKESRQSPELAAWIVTQQEATRTKLKTTVARLEAERKEKLRVIGSHAHDRRGVRTERGEASTLLSDGLIHAIQRLHLRK